MFLQSLLVLVYVGWPVFTYVYTCVHIFTTVTRVYLYRLVFSYVYHYLVLLEYLFLPMVTRAYLNLLLFICLPQVTYVYLCLPLFTGAFLPMFRQVLTSLPMLTPF